MTVGRHLLMQARRIGGGGGGPEPPPGSIAMWSGTLGTIPANWSLCDGGGGTPNLIARFLRGAPAATEPGTTGGSDTHTHASMTAAGGHTHTAQDQNHSHTVNSAGSHTHKLTDAADMGPGTGVQPMMASSGAHQHATNSQAHSHTMNTTANHTHPLSTNDGRPPYYEVAFIQAGAGAAVAVEIIIIWTGLLANIPAGWTLCDGGDTRPDLRTNFIRGVNTNVTDPGGVGGGVTHGHTETAQAAHSHTMNDSGTHSHSFTAFTWTHEHNGLYDADGSAVRYQTDSGAGNHTHAASNSIGSHNHNAMGNNGSHSHTVNAVSSLPAYYDVAYIINTAAAAIPSNGVLIWTGLLANIPAGYNLCDGGGGRPELRAKFLRGSADGVNPGGEGGSDSHAHTDQNAGAHSAHSMASAGAHQHAATNATGSHTHAESARTYSTVKDGSTGWKTTQAAGSHSHTYNNENAHTHTLTNPGNHNHNPWSTDDGRPAFYEVAFILKA